MGEAALDKPLITITVTDTNAGMTVFSGSFEAMPVRIGRHEENEVPLRGFPFVSRWHAEIRGAEGNKRAFALHMLAPHNPIRVGARSIETGTSHPIGRRLVATLGILKIDVTAGDDLPVFMPSGGPLGPVGPGLPQPPQDENADEPPVILDPGRERNQRRSARLQAAAADLRPIYVDLQRARKAWEDSSLRALSGLREAEDAEPDDPRLVFREFPPSDRPTLTRDDSDLFVGVGELGLVVEAASELLPGRRPPTGETDLRRFLARMVDVLRVFASCTIELQRTRDRQAADLGVTWADDADPLIAYDTRDELLRYLIDYREAGAARSEELVRLFSALVDHIDAYIKAAKRGAHAAVFSLSPSEMERSVATPWPTRNAALWRHYKQCFASFFGDTYDNLTPALRAHLARFYRESLATLGVHFETQDSQDMRGER